VTTFVTTFVDTSALYALLDADDEVHEAARETWGSLLGGEDESLISTNYVLLETFALVQTRLGMAAVRALSDHLLPVIRPIWISEDDHREAVQALLAANRRPLSLTDCSSFVVMRRLGVRSVFAFDDEFADQGFDCVPG